MTERHELINREEGHYPTSSMCRWAGVSRSGYYSWRDRPESITKTKRKELSIIIKDAFADSDGTYGYRRIQAYLERRGVRVDGATIRSIMHELGLEAAQPRAKVRTTVPAADLDERPDLVVRGHHLYQYVGRVRLSCYGSGLLHQEGRGVCDGRSYAHLAGV